MIRNRIISKLNHSINTNENFLIILLAVSVLSFIYVGLIGYITRFSLLYGSDYPGVYSISDLSFNTLTPDLIINSLSYLISFGNITLSFYTYFFLCTLSSFLVIYFFCEYILNHFTTINSHHFTFPFIGIFLYAIIPTAMAWTYYSVLRNVSLSYTLFTLSILIMLVFYEKIKKGEKIRIYQIISFSLVIALSSGSLPNGLRIMIIYFLIGFIMLSILIKQKYIFLKGKEFAKKFSIFLSFLFIFYLYYIFDFIINFKSAFQLEISGGANLSAISNYYGEFNKIQNVIRLLGISNWTVNPFNTLYWNFNIISIISYIWPFFAIFMPLLLIYKKKILDRTLFIFMYSLLLIAIIFATSLNPPFGQLMSLLYRVLPFGIEFLPSGFITNYVLSKIYLMMIIISIFYFSEFIAKLFKNKTNNKSKTFWKRGLFLKVFSILIILAIFLISSAPLVNGEAYHYTWGGNCEVYFHIPNSYNEARDELHTKNLNAILLPDLSPYITTSYGYKGSISFFSNYFGQNNVVTISNFYGIYANNSGKEFFYNLTHPVLTNKNESIINLNWIADVLNYRINSLLIINNVSYGSLEPYQYIDTIIISLSTNNIINKQIFVSDQVSIYTLNLTTITNLCKEK